MKGRCTCGAVRYELAARPLFTHCCHCRWCQRETGSAFVLNALIEAEKVKVVGAVEVIDTPSESGKGQLIHRCPACKVALWSVYAGAGPDFLFVRVGTLEDPEACPPDIHIFTESKQPWVALADGKPVCAQYYRRDGMWPAESLARRAAVIARRGGGA
jgi:hypothetical protein